MAFNPIGTTMLHSIHHRFTSTKRATFSNCNVCDKQILFLGYRCQYCKYYCHSDCVAKAPNSCGLPDGFFDMFKNQMLNTDSTTNTTTTDHTMSKPFSTLMRSPSSSSSITTSTTPLRDIQNTSRISSVSSVTSADEPRPPTIVDSEKSSSSTLTAVSQNSSSDYHYQEGHEHPWPSQGSLASNKEWEIPYKDIENNFNSEQVIGTGRYYTVYQGDWHGEVAIKKLNYLGADNERAFESFKQEVNIFRMTRHDNLVLFMGACMTPPNLAIVTSLCKGVSLHTMIHKQSARFELNEVTTICEQVCQGMGYLHSRDIIHKDLKTKNIFWHRDKKVNKVIITDFGLSSVTKLCVANQNKDRLVVPQGWLCYLAPEIIRTLSIEHAHQSDDLPFSNGTDIYAFGTLLYEMIFGEYPFTGKPSEVIIWQVGKGIKQPISNSLQSPNEIKDLLAYCWSYHPERRPTFAAIQYEYLQKIPKPKQKIIGRTLRRCPSHSALL